MKLIFCGQRGVGKSTIIRRLLPPNITIYGLETFFTDNGSGTSALYIRRPYDLQAPCSPQNQVGVRGPVPGTAVGFPCVFDTCGVALLQNIPAGSVIVIDELGYLEQDASAFLCEIRQILTGPYHVLAAIKAADCPHLRDFRILPGVKTLRITPENRDELYRFVHTWTEYADVLSVKNKI